MLVNTKNKEGKLIISHIADVDGMGSVIVAKSHFYQLDYILVEFAELEDAINLILKDNTYKSYNQIFITDISIRENVAKLIDKHDGLKERIKHFDHHQSEMAMNEKYSFINVIVECEGMQVSGTSLFYDYMNNKYGYCDNTFSSVYCKKFIEAVRSYDTSWTHGGNIYGKQLTDLFALLGPELFIEKFTRGLLSRRDPITQEELQLLNIEQEKIKKYVDKCDNELIRLQLDGHQIGISFSELYRSDVGNILSKKYETELDYILIVNLMRNQYSFRTIRDDINVSEIAKSYTKEGGGHPKAAGMPINSDTAFILELAIDRLIDNTKVKERTK